MSDLYTDLSDVAGELYVAAELSKKGYVASASLGNTKDIDVLVSNQEFTRQVNIQVKTNQFEKREWLFDKQADVISEDNFFYIFVNLRGEFERPEFFIVPSKKVSEYLKKSHLEWQKNPKRYEQPRKNGKTRKFMDPQHKYLEKWDFLGLDL